MFNTPGMLPSVYSQIEATFNELMGASSGDLNIPVHPLAKNGAILKLVIKIGKFQGVMHPTYPMGSSLVYPKVPALGPVSLSNERPYRLVMSMDA